MRPNRFGASPAPVTWGIYLCLMLPWLSPWAPSPLANTVPLLLSWACIGLLLIVSPQLRTPDVARAWAIAALISSVIGLIQYFGHAAQFSPWLHVPPYPGEAMGNLRQRNQLATHLGIGVLAVLYWQMHGLKNRHALWMLALLATGNAATGSRTGLLHMLLIVALSAAWSWRQHRAPHFRGERWPWRLASMALAVYLLATWALPALLAQASGQDVAGVLGRMGQHEGCGSRRVLWSNVLHLIGQKPWTGWGWGELKYAHYMADYPGERFCDILGNAHNLPLHLAFSLGVPLAAIIVLVALIGLIWLRPWASHFAHHQLAWSVLALIGLHSLLEFPLWYGPFQMATLLSLGMLLRRQHDARLHSTLAMRYLGLLILVGVTWVSVDYLRARQIYLNPSERLAWWRSNPLGAAQSSWFFSQSATFAQLSLTPVTPQNAEWVLQTSQAMLHHSPEPRVIRALIDSARLLGQHPLADEHQQRLQRAYRGL